MATTILRMVNRNGFGCIEPTSVNLTTTSQTFVFNRHPFVGINFQGGFFVRINSSETAPATAVPIQFTTSGVPNSTVNVYDAKGEQFTTANWPGEAIYLAWYDFDTNQVRLLNYFI
jgi:hypothetical protein